MSVEDDIQEHLPVVVDTCRTVLPCVSWQGRDWTCTVVTDWRGWNGTCEMAARQLAWDSLPDLQKWNDGFAGQEFLCARRIPNGLRFEFSNGWLEILPDLDDYEAFFLSFGSGHLDSTPEDVLDGN